MSRVAAIEILSVLRRHLRSIKDPEALSELKDSILEEISDGEYSFLIDALLFHTGRPTAENTLSIYPLTDRN